LCLGRLLLEALVAVLKGAGGENGSLEGTGEGRSERKVLIRGKQRKGNERNGKEGKKRGKGRLNEIDKKEDKKKKREERRRM
jgi:hypothetical protein